jgi:hypothetical protein
MERKTITIEEIKANPNLDLSQRIALFASDERWKGTDLEELAIASIKQEYEYYANTLGDKPYINTILSKVLNGHVFSQNELSEIMILDEDKRNEMIKYHELKDKVSENNGITLEDFNKVTEVMGIDSNTAELFRKSLEDSNLIIDSYQAKKH